MKARERDEGELRTMVTQIMMKSESEKRVEAIKESTGIIIKTLEDKVHKLE
jgi:hypothetical protein